MPTPMEVYRGRSPNPHVVYGQQDMENMRLTMPTHATRWDVQLSNGWERTCYGARLNTPYAGYLIASIPHIPGLTRMSSSSPSSYPTRGISPSQWQNYVSGGPGSQPQYPGGPGQIMGKLMNPGSG